MTTQPTVDLFDVEGWANLRLWSETFFDCQQMRKAHCNRLGVKADRSPTKSGANVDLDAMDGILGPLDQAEKYAKRMMLLAYRRVAPPAVIAWQKDARGVGEHLLARLLGATGHPRIATPYHWEGESGSRVLVADPMFVRSLRQWWQYCGHGAPLRRQKGMSQADAFAMGNPTAKMLAHLIAEACVKQLVLLPPLDDDTSQQPRRTTEAVPVTAVANPVPPTPIWPPEAKSPTASADTSPSQPKTPTQANSWSVVGDPLKTQPKAGSQATPQPAGSRYRQVYDLRRAHTATTQPEWTKGHSHNDALRIVAKEVLRDLWVAADLEAQL